MNRRGMAVNGRSVLMLGLSYKRGTGDAREAPSIRVAHLLGQLGADVRAADPFVKDEHVPAGVTRVAGDADDMRAADAIDRQDASRTLERLAALSAGEALATGASA